MSGCNKPFISQVFPENLRCLKHSPRGTGVLEDWASTTPTGVLEKVPWGPTWKRISTKHAETQEQGQRGRFFFPSLMPKDRLPHQSCQRDQITRLKIFTKTSASQTLLISTFWFSLVYFFFCRRQEGQLRGCVGVDSETGNVCTIEKKRKGVEEIETIQGKGTLDIPEFMT